jgi:hypothetical protein
MDLSQLMGLNQGPKQPKDPPLEVDDAIICMERAVQRFKNSPPATPEVGCVFLAYNGSLLFCYRTDNDGDFECMILAGGVGKFKAGSVVTIESNGMAYHAVVADLGIALAKNLGKPRDVIRSPVIPPADQ